MPFLVFVLCPGIVVKAVTGNGLAKGAYTCCQQKRHCLRCWAIAALDAALANLCNNLPAVLVLLH
jgi:arsenical pump membrane protein